ncbi:MAG: sulfite exporter TauE/SafE family protein [Betaproteobacteria bacterium]
MSVAMLALLAVIVMISAFVQGTIGVGFALIMAPILAFVAPDLLPVCLLVLMIPLNAYVAWRERAALDFPGAGWITAGRFLGTFGGLWVLAALTASHLGIVIGAATIVLAIVTLIAPAFKPNRRALFGAGVITGVAATATGIGGPPLALVYQHQPAPTLRSTIAFCFLVGQLISLAVLAIAGRVAAAQFEAAFLLLPAMAIGALVSRLAHHRVGGKLLRTCVMLFSIVSGAVLLVRA